MLTLFSPPRALKEDAGEAYDPLKLGPAKRAGFWPRRGRAERDRIGHAAILFADIVGFSRLSETLPPHKVMRMLRRFHARMAARVRAHAGRVANYVGDGLMAIFCAPDQDAGSSTSAVVCALDMLGAIDAWSLQRAAEGKAAIPVGIGIHCGPVVMGPIGFSGELQEAVVGDTVNVAKRLETMTRSIGSPLVVSDAVVAAVNRNTRMDRHLLAGLQPGGQRALFGRRQPISVWTLKSSSPALVQLLAWHALQTAAAS